jgi:dTDP-4-dehydrorhamnose 3,5-epimerase
MEYLMTELQGVWILEPKVFGDSRGYFMEAYKKSDFERHIGSVDFIQDNESKSSYGVLRGLHYQRGEFSQAKLVRVIKGEVFDVAVDLRKGSKTYGQWHGEILSETNFKQFYIPEGFAHGFLVVSDYEEFCYKCTDFYHPGDEGGLMYNDPEIGIEWPITPDMVLNLSDRDTKWGGIKDLG